MLRHLHFLLASLVNSVQAECPDPTGLGLRLGSTLSSQDRVAFVAVLLVAHPFAFQASEFAKAGNNPSALGTWRMLFPLFI
jgi:hypothetical protein